ncbi:uncharacterized protein MYCFIDRAFT_185427 [Pseudocercospora fijiensis CIRAD86]|uniref:PLC-like phosphodiesterase n=1 Tax=Pseudocercospora fijiensis (strain CIRAD86) TaxID=383855 RepID=N1Q826_PSEFD|nr:uncharacterized protein MYCFIDRAFT_185427 [Pseudocercospora fijiensis CIRAD86]EME88959.1 hypothetical protein MYCFIDRAFT_185427 [Pseudocercospora fijiensis CIRAD86]
MRHVQRQQICIGNAAFCDRRYSNVSLIGTHNSAFVGNFLDPRMNQEKTVTEQLDAGIRFIQAQTHMGNPRVLQLNKDGGNDNKTQKRDDADELSMCHTNCELLYAGNQDLRPMSEFDSILKSTGLHSLAYIPPTSPSQIPMNQWPTYGNLISDNKRLIISMDSMTDDSKVPYILSEFIHFFETPYGNKDPKFAQATIPHPEQNLQTNAATGEGSIGAQADLCMQEWDRPPNVVLVDMFDRGDVFTAQKNLNE